MFLNGFFRRVLLFALAASLPLAAGDARANPSLYPRSHEFQAPAALRPRVNFWRDIFVKYGKNQVVIHHREYPQVIFRVLDFSHQAAELNPIALDSYKRRETERQVKEIKQACRELSQGSPAVTHIQRKVAEEMLKVPGVGDKYRRAVDEDLIRSQTGIREKWEEAIRRSGRYMQAMERIFVKDFGLPVEVTRLPFVESSFDYQAYSAVGAAGIWQFMPRTARGFMTVNNVVDERLDPTKATIAAARYLSSAYRQLGTWPLAITSYNHGVGGVRGKVRKFGTTDISTLIEKPGEKAFGFASSNFYPSFLAAVEVYEQRKIYFPDVEPEPYIPVSQVRLPAPVYVDHVAQELGVEIDMLRRVNYALLDRVWTRRSPIPAGYGLQVPTHYAQKAAELKIPEIKIHPTVPPSSAVYGGITYRVRKGDTPAGIAKKYGITLDELLRLNKLGASRTIKIGQMLLIKPRESARPAPKTAASTPPPAGAVAANSSGAVHRVDPGETLSSIARRYHTTPDKIKELNQLKADRVRVGQELRVSLSTPEANQGKKKTAPAVSAKPHTYTIKAGDTLASIAKKYGTGYETLRTLNGMNANSKLKPGQIIKLP